MRRSQKMAKRDEDNLLLEDELAAAFLDDGATIEEAGIEESLASKATDTSDWDGDEEEDEDGLGTLAVDLYETNAELVVRARTAGVNKDDLDVSIADNILTIRGTLAGGDDIDAENYHLQECYWGEFERVLELPVPVSEEPEDIKAKLEQGVLVIRFKKLKTDNSKKISIG
jgi:HSP20 family protein